MALRTLIARRFLSTSPFTSQFGAAASNLTAPSSAAKPDAAPPSDTLYVSGLNKRTTDEKLQEESSKFGEVVQAKVVTDRATGYSKGFGFVKYATVEDAGKGIKGMDGQFLEGWVIFAEYARPRPPPGQTAYQGQRTYASRS